MAGMRDYSDEEIIVVRKSFSGRYALRDRCYFEMALQTGLRVSEMLSIRAGQVWQYGKVTDELSIERKYMKGGKPSQAKEKPASHEDTCPCNLCKPKRKGPTAHGRTLPIFDDTKPFIVAWLQRLAAMLKVDVKDLDPTLPLFMSRVRHKDGSRRAIARETAWRIIKGIARENELPGGIATHSTRKTLAQRSYDYAKAAGIEAPMRFTQKILGHTSISSTEHYVRSLTARQAWDRYRAGYNARAA